MSDEAGAAEVRAEETVRTTRPGAPAPSSIGALLMAAMIASCTPAPAPRPGPPAQRGTDPVREILHSHPGLTPVVSEAPRHRLQVVLGLIEDGPGGRPTLIQHSFRAGEEYFYPASSIKLFAAVAALEWLADLARDTGLAVGPDTPLVFDPLFAGEAVEDTDPSNLAGGRITVAHEIRKLFLVSDNVAFNRLYELVGQDGLAASLARAGLDGRIVHRLEEARTAEENRRSPRVELVGEDFRWTVPERTAPPPDPAPLVTGIEVGSAHLAGGERIDRPLDFSAKNRMPLADLQRGLCMVVRPEVDCGAAGFRLTAADRRLLVLAMSRYPRQSANPVYDSTEFPDDYVKPLLPGLARVVPKARLTIANKVGQAYGFTVENAYVADRKSGRAFFLAAVVYTNADGVINDDRYEYDELARPFLADLGEAAARWVRGDR